MPVIRTPSATFARLLAVASTAAAGCATAAVSPRPGDAAVVEVVADSGRPPVFHDMAMSGPPHDLALGPANGLTFVDQAAGSNLSAILSGIYWTFDVSMDDVDGDGLADVFFGDHGTDHRLAINNGDGTFSRGALPASKAQTWSLMMIDYDNDGQRDITTNWDTSDFPVYRGTGARSFKATSGAFSNTANSMAWSDWNGDGQIEYMTGGFFGSTIYKNTGGAFANATSDVRVIPAARAQASLYLADLSGDGWPDILTQPTNAAGGAGIFTDSVTHTTNLLLNKGKGAGFAAAVTGGLEGLPAPAVAVGDIDNDGDLDVLAVGSAPTGRSIFRVRLMRNDGGGSFTDITAGSGLPEGDGVIDAYQVIYLQAAIADFDNDGLQDIVWADPTSTHLYQNRGGGQFTEAKKAFADNHPTGRPTRLFVSDYNNDGTLDVAVIWVANPGSDQQGVSLYRNATTSKNWLGVRLRGTAIKLAVNSRVYVYDAGHVGEPAALRGYREVILSHSFRQPVLQHFGLPATQHYDVRAVFFPSGKQVDKLDVTTAQVLTIDEG